MAPVAEANDEAVELVSQRWSHDGAEDANRGRQCLVQLGRYLVEFAEEVHKFALLRFVSWGGYLPSTHAVCPLPQTPHAEGGLFEEPPRVGLEGEEDERVADGVRNGGALFAQLSVECVGLLQLPELVACGHRVELEEPAPDAAQECVDSLLRNGAERLARDRVEPGCSARVRGAGASRRDELLQLAIAERFGSHALAVRKLPAGPRRGGGGRGLAGRVVAQRCAGEK